MNHQWSLWTEPVDNLENPMDHLGVPVDHMWVPLDQTGIPVGLLAYQRNWVKIWTIWGVCRLPSSPYGSPWKPYEQSGCFCWQHGLTSEPYGPPSKPNGPPRELYGPLGDLCGLPNCPCRLWSLKFLKEVVEEFTLDIWHQKIKHVNKATMYWPTCQLAQIAFLTANSAVR